MGEPVTSAPKFHADGKPLWNAKLRDHKEIKAACNPRGSYTKTVPRKRTQPWKEKPELSSDYIHALNTDTLASTAKHHQRVEVQSRNEKCQQTHDKEHKELHGLHTQAKLAVRLGKGATHVANASPTKKAPQVQGRDVSSQALADDITKGAWQIKKKKIHGALHIASSSTLIWVVDKYGRLRCFNQNAQNLNNFGGEPTIVTNDGVLIEKGFGDKVYTALACSNNHVYAGTNMGQVDVYNTQTMTLVQELVVQSDVEDPRRPAPSLTHGSSITTISLNDFGLLVTNDAGQFAICRLGEDGKVTKVAKVFQAHGEGVISSAVTYHKAHFKKNQVKKENRGLKKRNQTRPVGFDKSDEDLDIVHYALIWLGYHDGTLKVYDLRYASNPTYEPEVLRAPFNVLNAQTQKAESELRSVVHAGGVSALCVGSHHVANLGQQVWSAGSDFFVRCWVVRSDDRDVNTFVPSQPLARHTGKVTCLRKVQHQMWSGSEDGKVALWDLKTQKLIGVLPVLNLGRVHVTDITIVGMLIYVCTSDSFLRVILNQEFAAHQEEQVYQNYKCTLQDLEEAFQKTHRENGRLHKHIRALVTQLRRSEFWKVEDDKATRQECEKKVPEPHLFVNATVEGATYPDTVVYSDIDLLNTLTKPRLFKVGVWHNQDKVKGFQFYYNSLDFELDRTVITPGAVHIFDPSEGENLDEPNSFLTLRHCGRKGETISEISVRVVQPDRKQPAYVEQLRLWVNSPSLPNSNTNFHTFGKQSSSAPEKKLASKPGYRVLSLYGGRDPSLAGGITSVGLLLQRTHTAVDAYHESLRAEAAKLKKPIADQYQLRVIANRPRVDELLTPWARDQKKHTIQELQQRLDELDRKWNHQRTVILGEWSLPWMHNEWAATMKETDQIQLEMAELLGTFYHAERELIAEIARLQEKADQEEEKLLAIETKRETQAQLHKSELSRLRRTEQQYKEQTAEIAEKKIPALNVEIDKVKPTHSTKQAEKAAIQREYEAKKVEVDQVLAELARAKAACKSLQDQIAEYNKDIAAAQKNTEALKKKAQGFQEGAMRDKIAKKTNDVNQQQLQLDALTNQAADLEGAKTKLSQNVALHEKLLARQVYKNENRRCGS
eukprot:gnl/Spiro4/23727_TR11729_c0_g1_i1.p1 gnl/Spiro4/23727_TR11729_c0_g1~~gnl/Spiro4/23727_TR11729_c0_g1_i1.p1  ORF type:complete len:1139 (-),score=313.05 gnl/Spiro4/23727_TR11729_c0_g1_i1:63-3407(-)